MGRHAKPIAVRLAEGSYRPHVHGPLDPSQFAALPVLPDEPCDTLDAFGRAVWKRHYRTLTDAGILTEGEREIFVAYCFAAGCFERARLELNKSGGLVTIRKKSGKRGSASFELSAEPDATVNPWYRVAREALQDVARLASLLGLTAVDRSRVVKTKTDTRGVPAARPKTKLDLMGKLPTG